MFATSISRTHFAVCSYILYFYFILHCQPPRPVPLCARIFFVQYRTSLGSTKTSKELDSRKYTHTHRLTSIQVRIFMNLCLYGYTSMLMLLPMMMMMSMRGLGHQPLIYAHLSCDFSYICRVCSMNGAPESNNGVTVCTRTYTCIYILVTCSLVWVCYVEMFRLQSTLYVCKCIIHMCSVGHFIIHQFHSFEISRGCV